MMRINESIPFYHPTSGVEQLHLQQPMSRLHTFLSQISTHGLRTALALTALSAALCLHWLVYNAHIRPRYFSPYSKLSRPPLKAGWLSLLLGNLPEMQVGNPGDIQTRWVKEHGNVVVYNGLFNQQRFFTVDPAALMYVLHQKNYEFPKPYSLRAALSNVLGEGVLVAEGDQHKRQRRIAQPTFNQSSVQSFLPVFYDHARQLVAHVNDNWTTASDEFFAPFFHQEGVHVGQGKRIIDALNWTSRTTLDIIGAAAFSHPFNSLREGQKGDRIANSFHVMMKGITNLSLVQRALLHFEQYRIFDPIRPLPTSFNLQARACYNAVADVSREMMQEKQQAKKETGIEETELEAAGKKSLLQRVLEANATDLLGSNEKLTSDEIIGQVTTILLAGHETTSTALTWTLYQLAKSQDAQTRLREEILEHFPSDDTELDFQQLHNLPVLDKVCNEILRLHPPVHSTNREAAHDDFIPLSQPVKQLDGTYMERIPVKKGQPIIIQIAAFNRSSFIWGDDAAEFNIDRWDALPESVTQSKIPGHTLSFLAGPRNCIGRLFALTEYKAVLALLMRNYKFHSLPKDYNVTAKQVVVTRPKIQGLELEGTQMPLVVERI